MDLWQSSQEQIQVDFYLIKLLQTRCVKSISDEILLSGIGFETSLGLVKRGAKVYLCCKTLELAKDAMKRIKLSGRLITPY